MVPAVPALFRIGAGCLAAASLLVGLAGSVAALDAPHNEHFTISCNSCHVAHKALGTTLTKADTNALLCQSCHDTDPAALAMFFPMPDSTMATPGSGGSSHAFGVLANNSTYGAGEPTNFAMSARLDKTDPANPKITCSVCHNQHTSSTYRGRQRVQAVTHTQGAGPASFGTLDPNSPSPTAAPRGFLIDFVVGGAVGTATYRLSYDNGTSWFGWNGTQWGALGTGTPPFNPRVTGASQNLTNTSGEVVVSFSGTFNGPVPGPTDSDRYKFYVGYPFYRVAADSGDNATGTRFCRDCHTARAQTHTDVETYVSGVKRSHPVGQGLNANARGYDRTGGILDVNGAVQGSGGQDSLAANDLVLDAGGLVQCTTCHLPHYAPSNSLYDPQGKR